MAAVRSTKAIISSLEAKGADVDNSHHVMLTKRIDGVVVALTRVSHGRKDVPPVVMRAMAKQCHLTLPEFVRLVDCPMSQGEWDELILERRVGRGGPGAR